MKITITPQQLESSTELKELAAQFLRNGGVIERLNLALVYPFDEAGEMLLSNIAVDLILAAGAEIHGLSAYSPVVPLSTLDNKVPADWPGALKTDPNDPEKTVTKEWQEACRVWPIDGGYLIEFGMRDKNMNGPELTYDMFLKFKTKFGGFQVAQEAQPLIDAWQFANQPVE